MTNKYRNRMLGKVIARTPARLRIIEDEPGCCGYGKYVWFPSECVKHSAAFVAEIERLQRQRACEDEKVRSLYEQARTVCFSPDEWREWLVSRMEEFWPELKCLQPVDCACGTSPVVDYQVVEQTELGERK